MSFPPPFVYQERQGEPEQKSNVKKGTIKKDKKMNGWLNMRLRTVLLFWNRNNANGLSANENPQVSGGTESTTGYLQGSCEIWALCCRQDHSFPVLSRV